jgi:Protein of unknown function (DUF2510)
MTSGQREVGWYPDPSGTSGQMYWDGRQWLAGIPAFPLPAAALPWDRIRPHMDRARPALDRLRGFWSGLTRQSRVMYAAAVLLVVVAAVGVSITTLSYLVGGSDKSPSYQAGYTSGSTGTAHSAAIGLGAQFACQGSLATAQLANSSLDANDYIQGCVNGIRDHPAGR